ncbi:MAG: cytochrome c peroxidase [Burkholderiales bacterium]|nr:cytochrome c peroxidase [Burkholderiales bacterium]
MSMLERLFRHVIRAPLCTVLFAASVLALPAQAQSFSGALSGAWWNPARNGEGIMVSFESAGGQNYAVVAFFTFTSTGATSWMTGATTYANGATTVAVPVVTASGARFGAQFRSEDVQRTNAGTINLDYISCTQMRLRYAGSENLTIDLSRIVGPLNGVACTTTPAQASQKDQQVRMLAQVTGQTGQPLAGRTLPSINDPLPQLGKLLFFSKALSGNLDTACASCHHPGLGGADGLSLSIGTGAVDPAVMGPGRRLANGGVSTPRNANTFFNVGLLDNGLFWDSRVESLGKLVTRNGAGSGIRTPSTSLGAADPNAGQTLPAAQARFPVASVTEMRGNLLAGSSDDMLRAHLAARLGNYGTGAGQLASSAWLARFRTAFNQPNGTAEQLITFDNIAAAIAEYQRSATFVDTPWVRFLRGDNAAISEDAKDGALLFFRQANQGGAQCVQCHAGDNFTNERHHSIGFPHIGPGMGDGTAASEDFGRGRETQAAGDRYKFRTPSLLNIELSAPYGHAGTYADLNTAVAHYIDPDATLASFLNNQGWCNLPQFRNGATCTDVTTVTRNSQAALNKMKADRTNNPADTMPVLNTATVPLSSATLIVEFLKTLTDPCLKDRSCYGRWIPTAAEAPDGHQLNAVTAAGATL